MLIKTRFGSILLQFLLLVTFTAVSGAWAQDEVLITDSAADYAFGQELRFSLQAQGAGAVEQLTLSLRPELSTNLYVVDVPFVRGESISVTQTIALSSLDVRPFAEITYSWALQTANGRQETPVKRFVYEDDRFPWQAMVREPLTAHWIGGEPFFGQIILDTAGNTMEWLSDILPVAEMAPVDIYVYPSMADVRSAMRLAGIDEAHQDDLSLGVILVTSVNPQTAAADLAQSIPYEMARHHLYRTAGAAYDQIPWWFREGITGSAGRASNPLHAQLLSEAVEAGETIPLWRLCELPRESGDLAQLAEAQSVSVAAFLIENQPPGTVAELYGSYLDGANCEAAIEKVLGWSLDELDRAWLASVRQPSSAQLIRDDAGIWIVLLAAGSVVAWILYRNTVKKEK